jgi:hypothetical protein
VLAFGAQLAAVATPAANDGDDGDVSRNEGGDLPVVGRNVGCSVGDSIKALAGIIKLRE